MIFRTGKSDTLASYEILKNKLKMQINETRNKSLILFLQIKLYLQNIAAASLTYV